jgi:hypothetical protein
MFNAHTLIPLSAAVAAEAVARVGGSRKFGWPPGMTHRTASLPTLCGVMR